MDSYAVFLFYERMMRVKKFNAIWCGLICMAVLLGLLSGCGLAPEVTECEETPAAEVQVQDTPVVAPEETAEEPVREELPPEEPVEEHDWQYHRAYMRGVDGFFFPDQALLRAEAAQLMVNLFGPRETTEVFWDVTENDWFYACVYEAAGYLPGDLHHGFRPYESVTPAEFIAAVALAAAPEGETPLTLEQAVEAGWLTQDDAVLPVVSRATAAAIVNSAVGREADVSVLEELASPVFVDVDPGHPLYADILEAAMNHVYDADTQSEHWHGGIPNSTRLSEGIHRSPKAAYYVSADGQVIREPGLLQVGDATYLIREDGQAAAGGLELLDGRVTYFGEDGVMLKNGAWGEYQFDADGFYTTGDENLDALVAETLDQCTTEDMTREEQLRACYDHVRAYKYLGRNSALPSTCKTIPMENAVKYATKIFETGKGDCYNFAAAFCFLARALGYEATAIAGSCGYVWSNVAITHGWVEIVLDGETWLFDPQIENYNIRAGISNETHSAYQVTYANAPGRYYPN